MKKRVIQVVSIFLLFLITLVIFGLGVFFNRVYSNSIPVEIRVDNVDYRGISMTNPWLWQMFLKMFDLGKTTQFTYRTSSQKGGRLTVVKGVDKIVFVLTDKPQSLYKIVSNDQTMQSYNLAYQEDSKTLEITGYWSEEGLSVLPGKLPRKLSVATVNALAFISSQAHGVSSVDGKENVSDSYDEYLTKIQKNYYSVSYISLYR